LQQPFRPKARVWVRTSHTEPWKAAFKICGPVQTPDFAGSPQRVGTDTKWVAPKPDDPAWPISSATPLRNLPGAGPIKSLPEIESISTAPHPLALPTGLESHFGLRYPATPQAGACRPASLAEVRDPWRAEFVTANAKTVGLNEPVAAQSEARLPEPARAATPGLRAVRKASLSFPAPAPNSYRRRLSLAPRLDVCSTLVFPEPPGMVHDQTVEDARAAVRSYDKTAD